MADASNKYSQNISGAFYVDDQCIDCDLCRETAPTVFRRNDEGAFSYVHRQPVTAEEVALAEQALEQCPTETIGRDGGG